MASLRSRVAPRRSTLRRVCWLALGLLFVACSSGRAHAQSSDAPVGLQTLEQRSTRYSAYSLPKGMWELDVGALGINSSEVYGRLGAARGFGHGLQLDLNLLHWAAGIFGVEGRWAFFENRYVGLAADVGFLYGHGAWIWILNDTAQEILADSDIVGCSGSLTASSPVTRWLQLDLLAQYTYGEFFGELGNGKSFYAESQIGARQVVFRPGLRAFASDATAIELAAKLPAYTSVPYQTDTSLELGNRDREKSRSGYRDAEFKNSWNIELGVRSRLQPWLYATVRVHYGKVAKALYGAPLYPSFTLEFRL